MELPASLCSLRYLLFNFRGSISVSVIGVHWRNWCPKSDGSTSFPFWLDDRTSGRFRVALVFKPPKARRLGSLITDKNLNLIRHGLRRERGESLHPILTRSAKLHGPL